MLSILELAESRGHEFTGRGRWRRGKQHDSLVIDTEKNTFFWNSRSISGGLLCWLVEIDGLSKEEALVKMGDQPAYCPPLPKPSKNDGPTPEQLASLTTKAEFYHGSLTPQARAYWHSQGIDDASIDYFKLGYITRRLYKPHCAAYTIPYWQGGRVINLRQRLADDSRGRYRGEFAGLGNHLFNIDGLSRQGGLIKKGQAILFEGEKKAIVGHQVGFRVAGIAGANTWESGFVEHFKAAGVSLVYIALDPGVKSFVVEQIAKDFSAAGIRAIISKLPDKPDDMIMQGMTPGELLAIIKGLNPRRLSPEALARKERILAESKAQKEERAKEQQAIEAIVSEPGFQAARAEQKAKDDLALNLADWAPDENGGQVDPEEIKQARALFTSARKWKEHCEFKWPGIDSETQFKLKLKENRGNRPCGEIRKRRLPNGQVETVKWSCGRCQACLKKGVYYYRRALCEIQGIEMPAASEDEVLRARLEEPEQQKGGVLFPAHPGEPAPPLARIHGPLSLFTVYSDKERATMGRNLRLKGIRYRCFPITLNDGLIAYDFLINSDDGDPIGVRLTDSRLEKWVMGAEGKRSKGSKKKGGSGELLPSMGNLEARYRDPAPYEVVMPELDDDGELVDPDIFALTVPDIGTKAPLPPVAVDYEARDAESLQAAILEVYNQQMAILARRPNVVYGVYSKKFFYTRYTTLPDMLREFNARNEAIKAKQPTG